MSIALFITINIIDVFEKKIVGNLKKNEQDKDRIDMLENKILQLTKLLKNNGIVEKALQKPKETINNIQVATNPEKSKTKMANI